MHACVCVYAWASMLACVSTPCVRVLKRWASSALIALHVHGALTAHPPVFLISSGLKPASARVFPHASSSSVSVWCCFPALGEVIPGGRCAVSAQAREACALRSHRRRGGLGAGGSARWIASPGPNTASMWRMVQAMD
jgi:hypothetical protein